MKSALIIIINSRSSIQYFTSAELPQAASNLRQLSDYLGRVRATD